MKRLKKVICLSLAVIMLYTLCACVSKKSDVITIGSQKISAGMYCYLLAQQKSEYLNQNSLTETEGMWNEEYDDDYTIGGYLEASVLSNMVSTCLWRNQFETLELSFSEEEQKTIDENIASMEEAYGGKEALETELKNYGITYDEYIETVYYDVQKILKVVDHYFGADGVDPVPEQEVTAYFEDNYVRCKHVLISTLDDSGATVTGDDMRKAKETAQSVFEQAKKADESAFDTLVEKYNEDEGMAAYPDGYLFTTGEMVTEFEDAAFDMAVGETRLVQSQFGYHIIRKLTLDNENVFTNEVRQNMLLKIKSTEVRQMMDEWMESVNIHYNKSVMRKYNCNTIEIGSTPTTENNGITADQVAAGLGLTDEDKIS